MTNREKELEQAKKDAQVLLHCFRACNDKDGQERMERIVAALDNDSSPTPEGALSQRFSVQDLIELSDNKTDLAIAMAYNRGLDAALQKPAVDLDWNDIQNAALDAGIVLTATEAADLLHQLQNSRPKPETADPPYCGSCGITTTDNLCACDRGKL